MRSCTWGKMGAMAWFRIEEGCDFTQVLRGSLWLMAESRWMRENVVQARGAVPCTRVGFPLGLGSSHLLWSCL